MNVEILNAFAMLCVDSVCICAYDINDVLEPFANGNGIKPHDSNILI